MRSPAYPRATYGRMTARRTICGERDLTRRHVATVTVMDLTIHQCFLPHTDHEAALAFWRDTLGFEVRNDVEYQGMHWITVGPPGQPETAIVLHPPGADPQVTDEERQVITGMMAKGTFAAVNLATSDVDGTFRQLRDRGAEVLQEPTDQPWGIRDCAFRDPSGNMVRTLQVR